MPIYKFACPTCGHELEKIVKMGETTTDCPKCAETFKEVGGQKMELVLSTPSNPRWACSTAHSRSKGF